METATQKIQAEEVKIEPISERINEQNCYSVVWSAFQNSGSILMSVFNHLNSISIILARGPFLGGI
jgi:hypothetical protein